MTTILLSLAAVSAVVNLVAWYRDRVRLGYATKPLTTLLIMVAAALMPSPDRAYQLAIVIGLAFSLAGDIFLMLPRDHFIAGLLSFLVAHIAYIAAFSRGLAFGAHPLLALPYAAAAIGVLLFLWPNLGKHKIPVIIYVAALVAMAWQATSRAAEAPLAPAIAAAVGAALFIASDATLAINRFRRPFRAAQGVIMTTYVAAQMLIAVSVA